jgi:hypothetical protein
MEVLLNDWMKHAQFYACPAERLEGGTCHKPCLEARGGRHNLLAICILQSWLIAVLFIREGSPARQLIYFACSPWILAFITMFCCPGYDPTRESFSNSRHQAVLIWAVTSNCHTSRDYNSCLIDSCGQARIPLLASSLFRQNLRITQLPTAGYSGFFPGYCSGQRMKLTTHI